jgi:hypothetical protein
MAELFVPIMMSAASIHDEFVLANDERGENVGHVKVGLVVPNEGLSRMKSSNLARVIGMKV